MSWTPPERPEWARLMNAGAIPEMAAVARAPLTLESLLAEARAAPGIDDGGDADFGPRTSASRSTCCCRRCDQEAELTLLGRWLTRRHLLRLLRSAIRSPATWGPTPAPSTSRSRRRSSSRVRRVPGRRSCTPCSRADPALRAPLGWELLLPVPPPVPASVPDEQARVELAESELRSFADADPGLDAIHEYGARNPKECISAMSFAFRSEEFVVRYNVPSYTRWLAGCDMRPAYDYHRLVLSLLQRRSPRRQWVLKSPVHLHSLSTLLDVYPDARVAVTHRDPLAVLGSVSSLVAHLRWAHSDRVDLPAIGSLPRRALRPLAERARDRSRSAAGRARPDALRVRMTDLVADPVGAAAGVLRELEPAVLGCSAGQDEQYVDARPRGRHGSHEYSFDELGLDAAAERNRFAPYTNHFSVPDEVS